MGKCRVGCYMQFFDYHFFEHSVSKFLEIFMISNIYHYCISHMNERSIAHFYWSSLVPVYYLLIKTLKIKKTSIKHQKGYDDPKTLMSRIRIRDKTLLILNLSVLFHADQFTRFIEIRQTITKTISKYRNPILAIFPF